MIMRNCDTCLKRKSIYCPDLNMCYALASKPEWAAMLRDTSVNQCTNQCTNQVKQSSTSNTYAK